MNTPSEMAKMWAVADDAVDRYLAVIRTNSMTTQDMAMLLLAMPDENLKLNLAVIGATALQRLADR